MSQREGRQCRHCGERFDRADGLAHHWYRDHGDELLEEELRAAVAEDVRRQEAHLIPVTVPIAIPRETWRFVCERVDLDPTEADPRDLEDHLMDLLDMSFAYEVEPRTVTTCPACEHEYTEEEARSITCIVSVARWQCPECGEWSRGPPPSERED